MNGTLWWQKILIHYSVYILLYNRIFLQGWHFRDFKGHWFDHENVICEILVLRSNCESYEMQKHSAIEYIFSFIMQKKGPFFKNQIVMVRSFIFGIVIYFWYSYLLIMASKINDKYEYLTREITLHNKKTNNR